MPGALSARFHTFGCRLNQAETESIADAFSKAGFRIVSGDGEDAGEGDGEERMATAAGSAAGADFVVVNTCTVTTKAEQKARRVLRAALRENPRAVLLVTGCYAELDGDSLRRIGERAVVVPGSRKDDLLRLPALLSERSAGHEDPLDSTRSILAGLRSGLSDPFAFDPSDFRFHSRASLKVQDGCGNACAFCRVRLARGPSRSLSLAEAVARAARLEAGGYAETVLTGVNLSQYRDGRYGFPELLEALVAGTRSMAFRISSYEPDLIEGAFARASAHPRVRPFFHLPLQSGSPATLKRMGRDDDVGRILKGVGALRAGGREPFISLDMIAGFPGETDEEFRESADFAKRLEPAWIHVFPYSPRPGTAALSMRPQVPQRIATERAAELTDLARKGKERYAALWFGKSVEAIVEEEPGTDGSPGTARSENALRVSLRPDRENPPHSAFVSGRPVRLRLSPALDPSYDAEGLPERA